jgi:hypothetical protein
MFNYFPYIEYNNLKGTHLLRKVSIISDYLKDYNRFYTYIVKEGERPDIIAYNEYGDSNLDWVVMLVNNVQDPYYDWVMDDNQLKVYLEQKYNTAIEKLDSTVLPSSIKHYYYKGLNSDTQEEIKSYNYTMAPETYNYKLAQDVNSVAGWVPKTIFAYEHELNESKREIKLLREDFVSEFKMQFRDLIS